MIKVIKRDNDEVDFNLGRIKEAIVKAFNATENKYTDEIIDLISLRVTSDFQSKIKDGKVKIEEIQDSVEKALEQTGYNAVAKAYILYRKSREKLRNMTSTSLDFKNVVNSYLNVEDWRVYGLI